MSKITMAVKVDSKVAEKVRRYCAERGIKQGFLVERALEEKLEQEETLEDALEFKRWKHELPMARDYKEYIRERTTQSKAKA